MDLALAQRTVLVTGASGGIGRALALAFAAEGANLVLHASSRPGELDAFVAEHGLAGRALTVRADVARAAEIDAACAAGVARFGRLDAAVVNAGVFPPEDLPLHAMPEARLRLVVEVNLVGALLTARAFLRELAAAGPRPGFGAALIFIGSTAGRFGEAGHAEYAAAKAALRGLTLSLKNEIVALDPEGRVNLVDPGWVATDMARHALDNRIVERTLRTMPLRRIAAPEDVARAVVWLASPAARHVSGEFMTVAGGMEGRVLWE